MEDGKNKIREVSFLAPRRQPNSTKDLVFSFTGMAGPLLVGIISIPIILHLIGNARLGFLSMVWIIIGYFGIFDLGMGRALTKEIARLNHNGNYSEIWRTSRYIFRLMSGLSVAGMLVILLSHKYLIAIFGTLPDGLLIQATNSIFIIALTIPAVVLSGGYRGGLEGFGNFRASGLIRALNGSWMFAGPLLTSLVTSDLAMLTFSLLIGRYVTLLAFRAAFIKSLPKAHKSSVVDVSKHGNSHVVIEAGWMAVSNVVGPIMVYMDRFLISAMCGLAVVPYYSVPYDAVSRLTIFPEAVYTVLFPKMAKGENIDDGNRLKSEIYSLHFKVLCLSMFSASVLIISFSPVLLGLWLGESYRMRSSDVLSILMIGIFVNTGARAAYNALQANGYADRTAQVHLYEIIPYLALLYFLLTTIGLVGVAIAWCARAAADLILMTLIAHRTLNIGPGAFRYLSCIFLTVALLTSLLLISDQTGRFVLSLAVIFIGVLSFHFLLVSESERATLKRSVVNLRRFIMRRSNQDSWD